MNAHRPIGPWGATALVVGSMIGSGVFLLPATLAPWGAASLWGWGLTLSGALLLATVYAWLAGSANESGGSYLYARRAFGDDVAFFVAWSNWICMWVGNAALAVAFAGSLGALVPAVAASPTNGALAALAALWLATLTNLAGLREVNGMQLATTMLKIVPLVLFGVFALGEVDLGRFHPVNPSGEAPLAVVSSVAAITLWAFLGFEAATIPAGSVRDASRVVPRATVIGMLIAGIATMLACTVVIGLLPRDVLAASTAPMAEAAAAVWGPTAGTAIAVVATVSCFGALNGWVMLQAQVPMAAARDGLFPSAFGRTDARGTPRLGLVLSSGLATALVFANYDQHLVALFTFAILLATAAALLPYALSVAAWWHSSRGEPAWRKGVALLAISYAAWALVGTGREALLWGGALLLAGVPVLAVLRQRRAH